MCTYSYITNNFYGGLATVCANFSTVLRTYCIDLKFMWKLLLLTLQLTAVSYDSYKQNLS